MSYSYGMRATRYRLVTFSALLSLSLTIFLTGSEAVTFDQLDDFEDGTTEDWAGNLFGTLQNVASGGPTGAADNFLQTSISSFHLGTRNTNDWTGDFVAAGIVAVEMDLNHIPPILQPINIRILVQGAGGSFASTNVTAAISTNEWNRYTFGLTTNDLVHVTGGTGILEDTITNVVKFLIRHDSNIPTPPGSHPPHVTATLGIDNIETVLREPVMAGVSLSGGVRSIAISDMIVGTSNVVQWRASMVTGDWGHIEGFVVSSETANIVITNENSAAFFRSDMP